MNTKRFYLTLVVLLLVVGCEQADVGRDKALSVEGAAAEADLSTELKIYKSTLLENKSEQLRIDAATVLLFSEEPLAREILLDVLKQSENIAARVAVCKALSQARASAESIKRKEDFIPPLFDILNTETDESAKSAAEAILIFEYGQISGPLERMVTDSALPVEARLNAIYALRLQPDMRAIFKLIDRLDDRESQVAAEAERALRSLGTPIGKDAEARKQIRTDLKRKGRDEFFRDLLIRQEAKMRDLQAERDQWKKRYLSVSDRMYDGIGEDTVRSEFLADYLGDSEATVRLWALEKVSQWRVGTKSNLPAELGPILVNLVSDQNRSVRLKTAKLLPLMGQLNSSEKLLEQIEAEQDNEVGAELFVALGWACYNASLPDSKTKISPEIKKHTLELASEYLSQQEPKNAQKGAEVVKKLLAQDGLTSADVAKYLGLLAERYKQEKGKADGDLRGELLSRMAVLCAQSVYKAEARNLFKTLFEQALNDETDLVRQAAVDGLTYIDRTRALKIFRKVLVNDSSIKIREKLINLAGEVGGKEDLVWLAEKIGSTTESGQAWQAMLKIFKQSDVQVIEEWLQNLTSQGSKAPLSDEQMISFLKIAEQKAVSESKPEMLKSVRVKLAELYSKADDFKQAAEYLGLLHQTTQGSEDKQAILADLLDVYLKWQNVQAVSQLVGNCLLQNDLDANSVIVHSIDDYLTNPPVGGDPTAVLGALAAIELTEPRPGWQLQIKYWTESFMPADSKKPE
ncbi:MAG: HEAT repeat domain-containing protein [Planctomycetota bacterium]|jgi:HEAT repeat protein